MSKHNPNTPREFCDLFSTVATDVWQSGSHKTHKMPDGRLVTVACHNRELPTGTRCKLAKVAKYYGLLAMVIIVAAYIIL